MRRFWLAAPAAALTLAFVPALAMAQGPTLTAIGGTPFPNRTFVLSLPTAKSIAPRDVKVRENDHSVASLSVLPAQASPKDLAVVLVIDTSRSMNGRPILGAMAAARAFVQHRSGDQQVGVITFNRTATTRLPLTTDSARINAALSGVPDLGRETHIYDALGAAVAMLRRAGIHSGSVVLLSDGSDTGSALQQATALAAAQKAGVRVFSVGLHSGAFDSTALQDLARRGSGTYTEAGSSQQLASVYNALGAKLAHEYIIRYRSLQPPHARVTVQVSEPSTPPASAAYLTPGLARVPAPPFHPDFWGTGGALAITCLICALLLALATWAVCRSRPARRGIRARVSDFVSSARSDSDVERPQLRMLGGANRAVERKEWWQRFCEDVEIARIDASPVQLAAIAIAGAAIAITVLVLVSQSVVVGLIGLLAPLAVRGYVNRELSAQRRAFSEQLGDNLQVIASAMRSGQSLVGAMSVALHEAPEPTRSEFQRVVDDEQLGVPLEDAIGVVARRMDNRDLDQVQVVAALQRETGGNTAEVLDRVVDTIRERLDLRRTVKTLTAQGRMSRWVLTALAPALVAVIALLNPGYMRPLFHTSTGHVLLVVCTGAIVAGSLVIRRIVDIKV